MLEQPATLRRARSARPAPARLKRIVLQAAPARRSPDDGEPDRYTLTAPLDSEGHIDPQAWADQAADCRVVRETADGRRQEGLLWHGERAGWFFLYPGDQGLEAAYEFHLSVFIPGQKVSLRRLGREYVLTILGIGPA
ncbi:hypothetical protein [Phenylobacterium koreense]|uniref:Uncharacterized protein n=1 Tax=Phenylobacterium koreense TaxID=266125 RepID=A0ABV2ELQ7_9CAUL